MGCSWSKPPPDPSSDPQELVESASSYVSEPIVPTYCVREAAASTHSYREHSGGYVDHRGGYGYEEEHLFFQTFFSVLDRFPGYHGTLQRWKNSVQRAAEQGSHILKWDYIWREDHMAYLRTLRRVSELAEEDCFTDADLVKLVALAKKVVKHREREYYQAKGSGRDNWSHQKVKQGWSELVGNLENLID
ncbi:hypothetical protein scyTo_0017387 [Scyliorhinus torazame]|uniref:Uncharacterized protein n=1 Tax=Scyliorhinus torazame TaxID=75743 RepID=A0A401PRM8_SCYTO|nr:hypothetical protein [Scyliorhinus torazame]